MTNQNQLQRLAIEGGYDLEEILERAEIEAVEQEHECWGLTARQSDLVMWIRERGFPYCVFGLAIYYYRSVNGLQ